MYMYLGKTETHYFIMHGNPQLQQLSYRLYRRDRDGLEFTKGEVLQVGHLEQGMRFPPW